MEGMPTPPPGLQAPLRTMTTADELNRFWGRETTSSQQGTAQQAQHDLPLPTCGSDDLQSFWGTWLPEQVFDAPLDDFLHEIQQPALVPNPAVSCFSIQRDSSMDAWHEGEGWRSSHVAWSLPTQREDLSKQAKQVDKRQDRHRSIKRSYRRACQRAMKSPAQGTWYRGQWMTSAALQSQYVPNFSRQVKDTRLPGLIRKDAPHYNILSWNPGGLAANNWDILQNWLVENSVDICCLQETHWSLVQEWCNGKYYVLHHGHGRAGGLMTLIRTNIAERAQIRSGTLADGRIQHVRIVHADGGLDIVNVYQRVWSHNNVERLVAQRLQVWTALATCLDGIPARNQVIVCGDMNTQLPRHDAVTGPAIHATCYRDARDEHELLDILRVHKMVAINTFSDPKPYTYENAETKTQLDYIFMRDCQAKGHSKKARGLHQFPLLAARGTGFHVPISARIPAKWKIWRATMTRTAMRGPSNSMYASYIETHTTEVQGIIQQELTQSNEADGPASLEELDQALLRVQSRIQSAVPRDTVVAKPWQDNQLQGILSCAWQHLRKARSHAGKSLKSLFYAWRQVQQFLGLIKSTRKYCRRLRRLRFLRLLSEAQEQAKHHNIHGVFKVVNKLAPRGMQKAQMRNKDGTLMDARQEGQTTALFLQQVYQDADRPIFHSEPIRTGTLLTCQELRESLCKLPAKKAGPRHLACHAIYKHSAPLIAPILTAFLQRWWGGHQPYIPQPFKDAWLTMLPKPGRPCKNPSDLRPIGLSHPLGKCVLRALRAKILPYAVDYLHGVPQWGFIPGREAADALSRAFSHCKAVRDACKGQASNIHRRKAGTTPQSLTGGLTIALDISRAFDAIPHVEIYKAMCAAEIPSDICHLAMTWLTGAQYHVGSPDGQIPINVCRGVRQGCVLSPLLYVLVVARIHHSLKTRIGEDADHNLDYFADDTLFHMQFDSMTGFHLAVSRAEALLTSLEEAGLTINDNKTQVLLKLCGSRAKKLRKDALDVRKGQPFLRLSTLWTQRFLPVVSKAKYLGTQLSYDGYEDHTTQHRLTAARAAFGRLRRVLTSHSDLSLRVRIRLWTTCIGTCLYYGLESSGVTLSGLQKIRVLVQKQLRAIARQPTHITHVSNKALLDDLGVTEPGTHLRQKAHAALERWRQSSTDQDNPSIKAQAIIGDWRQRILSQFEDMLQQEQTAGRSLLACPHCGKECLSKTVLGSHIAQMHSEVERPVFDRALHSIGGVPQCSGCKAVLSTWARLQKHIEHGACPFPVSRRPSAVIADEKPPDHSGKTNSAAAQDQPMLQQIAVKEYLQAHGWQNMILDRQWIKLSQWCCICGTWCASNRAVKMHLAKSHRDIWNQHKERVERLCKSQLPLVHVPCRMCGSTSKEPKAHVIACPVIFQSILLYTLLVDDGHVGSRLLSTPAADEKPDECSHNTEARGSRDDGWDKQTCQDGGAGPPKGATPRQGSLQSWIRAGPRRGGHPEVGGGNGAPDSEAGGCSSGLSTGLRVHVVCRNGTRRHPSNDVWNQFGVEKAQGPERQAFDAAVACPDVRVHVPGASGTHQPHHQGRAGQEHGDTNRVDHGNRGLDVQALGSGATSPSGLQKNPTGHPRLGAPDQGATDLPPGARCLTQISGIPAGQGGNGNHPGPSGGLLHVASLHQKSKGGVSTSGPCSTLRQHGPSAASKPSSSGTVSSTWAGATFDRPPSSTALHLVLRNAGNCCYTNALVHVVVWLMAVSNQQVTCLGQGQNAWRAIMAQRKACSLIHMLPWTLLLRGWRHGGEQHDIREFFHHIVQTCQVTPFHGVWEARFEERGMLQVHDNGSCTQMISIDVPANGDWALQDVINAWGHQTFIHGVTSAPHWLAVRLNRFVFLESRLQKIRAAMSWDREACINIPVFQSGNLQLSWKPYKVCALVIHLGEHVQSGHYRALLVDHASGTMHYCDDDKRAKVFRSFDAVSSDVYVVFLIACDITQCATPDRAT